MWHQHLRAQTMNSLPGVQLLLTIYLGRKPKAIFPLHIFFYAFLTCTMQNYWEKGYLLITTNLRAAFPGYQVTKMCELIKSYFIHLKPGPQNH